MFEIGDKVFYPMHGGGLISAIEEKEILGETKLYYILDLLHIKMQVMIPANTQARLGIRQIVNRDKLDSVFNTFHDGETDLTIPTNHRPRKNLEKIRGGDIFQGAEVIRDLVRINNNKKLGSIEKNMLANVMQLLISEVILVNEISLEEASVLVEQVVNMPFQCNQI